MSYRVCSDCRSLPPIYQDVAVILSSSESLEGRVHEVFHNINQIRITEANLVEYAQRLIEMSVIEHPDFKKISNEIVSVKRELYQQEDRAHDAVVEMMCSVLKEESHALCCAIKDRNVTPKSYNGLAQKAAFFSGHLRTFITFVKNAKIQTSDEFKAEKTLMLELADRAITLLNDRRDAMNRRATS